MKVTDDCGDMRGPKHIGRDSKVLLVLEIRVSEQNGVVCTVHQCAQRAVVQLEIVFFSNQIGIYDIAVFIT